MGLPTPPGAFEPEPGSTPRWTAPRIWKRGGLFGIRSRRVIRWFWSNVGTITSEESVRVLVDGQVVGSVAASGGNAEQDTAVCQAGIAAFMRHLGKAP